MGIFFCTVVYTRTTNSNSLPHTYTLNMTVSVHHAYRNATLLSIISGGLFYFIFGLIPGLIFGFLHFLGNINAIKSSPINSIPAMKITTKEKLKSQQISDGGILDE